MPQRNVRPQQFMLHALAAQGSRRDENDFANFNTSLAKTKACTHIWSHDGCTIASVMAEYWRTPRSTLYSTACSFHTSIPWNWRRSTLTPQLDYNTIYSVLEAITVLHLAVSTAIARRAGILAKGGGVYGGQGGLKDHLPNTSHVFVKNFCHGTA